MLKTYGADTTSAKPSHTFALKNGRISGFVDGIDAVAQSIELILSTERQAYGIFSADYGAELRGLIGKRRGLVVGDIERRITQALEEDDRITRIEDFVLTFDRESALVSFTAITVFGNLDIERGVNLGNV